MILRQGLMEQDQWLLDTECQSSDPNRRDGQLVELIETIENQHESFTVFAYMYLEQQEVPEF